MTDSALASPAATTATSSTGDGLRPRPRGFSAFVRKSPLGAFCLFVILFAIAFALIGPFVGTGNPEKINPLSVFAGPSREFPMGTDYLGRSVMARLAIGMRVSLLIALLAAGLAAVIGAAIGLVSGYAGGIVDEIIGRLADILFAFPTMLLGLLIVMVLEPGIQSLVVTILVVTLPIFVRVARGPTLGLKSAEYVIAARVSGASTRRLIFRHILPNLTGPLLVQTTFSLSVALIAEGALSFLGLGVQPPQPSLGSLLRDGKTYMELAPWTMLFPALTLAGIILAINLLGDELQGIIDPRLRGR
ncbi:MAG: ABC transporter permease [Thermomicrobiales bacterium]|nr:ABC transporter permease [Thermomicrobiales bacterium]